MTKIINGDQMVDCKCGKNDWHIEEFPTPKIKCYCGSILRFLD